MPTTFTDEIKKIDPEIADAIEKESKRQFLRIELIASENFVSRAVLEAMGTPLTNKYAEGYPGKRYYGGCEYVDVVEELAIARLKKLFGAEGANVQPHSGSQANTAVFFAVLKPGDTYLGMNLNHGGHLTHGSPVNISGKHFNVIPYGVSEKTSQIDYDEVRKLALEHKPKLILAGASAYPRKIDFSIFREIANEVGCYLMVDIAHIAGLIVAGLHENPVPYADFVTTTTHKTLRGPRGGAIMFRKEHETLINKAVFPGCQGGPLMHVIAAKAICFKEADSEDFKRYQNRIIDNAKILSESLMKCGLELVSGGTDNHLMLLDLRNKKVTGREIELKLDQIGISVNRNMLPNDHESPFVTSGIRVGTPAVTTRGMGREEMEVIANIINRCITDFENSEKELKNQVNEICLKYPLY